MNRSTKPTNPLTPNFYTAIWKKISKFLCIEIMISQLGDIPGVVECEYFERKYIYL